MKNKSFRGIHFYKNVDYGTRKIRNFVDFRARAAAKVVKSVFSMCYNFSKNIIRKCLCTHWTKSQNFTRIIVKKTAVQAGYDIGKKLAQAVEGILLGSLQKLPFTPRTNSFSKVHTSCDWLSKSKCPDVFSGRNETFSPSHHCRSRLLPVSSSNRRRNWKYFMLKKRANL